MFRLKIASLTLVAAIVPSLANCAETVFFNFDDSAAGKTWRTVNDGVMGGRSEGRFKVEGGVLEFFGNLSLANNGGFASVRQSGGSLGLADNEVIVLRVRGDGRTYSMNLYTPTRRIAFSYRQSFKTKKGEWVEVRLPVSGFVATSFGRQLRGQKLDANSVNGVGIVLGDKKPGPFALEIDWIKSANASN